VELTDVVNAAIDTVRPALESKGLTLHTDIGPAVDGARIDPERMQQVLWNLLSNAVKFTPAGGRVDVTMRRHDGGVRIVVADNGAGIPLDFLPYVFDRFRQAETGTTRLHGGLGLGLTISRQIESKRVADSLIESQPPEGQTVSRDGGLTDGGTQLCIERGRVPHPEQSAVFANRTPAAATAERPG